MLIDWLLSVERCCPFPSDSDSSGTVPDYIATFIAVHTDHHAHSDSAKFKPSELFILTIPPTKSVVFFPTPANALALWIPARCPPIQFSSDTNYPELAETPKVKGSVSQHCPSCEPQVVTCTSTGYNLGALMTPYLGSIIR